MAGLLVRLRVSVCLSVSLSLCLSVSKCIYHSICEPVSCGIYPTVDNGIVSPAGSIVQFQDYVTITCDKGFIFSAEGARCAVLCILHIRSCVCSVTLAE